MSGGQAAIVTAALIVGALIGRWRRWDVARREWRLLAATLHAFEQSLPSLLRAALQDDGAAHEEAAGWAAQPGGCGVECLCGVVFDGFDTLDEAHALLADHIRSERRRALARIRISAAGGRDD